MDSIVLGGLVPWPSRWTDAAAPHSGRCQRVRTQLDGIMIGKGKCRSRVNIFLTKASFGGI
jgi:hypothetical protein